MKSRLEIASNIAFIVSCAVLVVLAFLQYERGTKLQAALQSRPSPYQVGQSFESPDGVPLSNGYSLIVFVRSSCKYCSNSMPLYRKLVEDRGRSYKVIAVSTDRPETLQAYLNQHDFRADAQATIAPGALKTGATPTLILVDGARRVKGYWHGQLSADTESELLRELRGL